MSSCLPPANLILRPLFIIFTFQVNLPGNLNRIQIALGFFPMTCSSFLKWRPCCLRTTTPLPANQLLQLFDSFLNPYNVQAAEVRWRLKCMVQRPVLFAPGAAPRSAYRVVSDVTAAHGESATFLRGRVLLSLSTSNRMLNLIASSCSCFSFETSSSISGRFSSLFLPCSLLNLCPLRKRWFPSHLKTENQHPHSKYYHYSSA